jgi:hypothetical protein
MVSMNLMGYIVILFSVHSLGAIKFYGMYFIESAALPAAGCNSPSAKDFPGDSAVRKHKRINLADVFIDITSRVTLILGKRFVFFS